MDTPISEEESFTLSYGYFWQALSILAKDAETQCEIMGNYNVAWEIKDDVGAGKYLLNAQSSSLSQEQRACIASLVQDLESIPPSVFANGTSADGSVNAMHHPCWVPLRACASLLLQQLPLPSHEFRQSDRSGT